LYLVFPTGSQDGMAVPRTRRSQWCTGLLWCY